MTYDPETYAALFLTSLRVADADRPRSVQSTEGRIGISDIFTCKEKVRRTILNEGKGSDDLSMSAYIGTAIHSRLAQDRKAFNPRLLVEQPVVVTLPDGVQIPGTADEIDPDEPSTTDDKTADGLGVVRNTGGTDQQRAQRHLYHAGAAQAGLVPYEGVVRNVWVDRSGREQTVHVEQEPYNPEVLFAAAHWLSDVTYAVKNGEPAERNPSLCAFCPFHVDKGGTCGADMTYEGRPLTPEQASAASLLHSARQLTKAAALDEKAAKSYLDGVDGIGHGWSVWHTRVNAATPYVTTNVKPVSAAVSSAA